MGFSMENSINMKKIIRADSNFVREKLITPFGLKGVILLKLGKTAVEIKS